MKLRVGYVNCETAPVEGSLDATLIRVMDCSAATNGGGYTDGGVYVEPDPVLYPKDPINILPPPPPLPEDSPSETLETLTPTSTTMEVTPTTDPVNEPTVKPIPPALIIGGGLLLLFFLGKNKKRK